MEIRALTGVDPANTRKYGRQYTPLNGTKNIALGSPNVGVLPSKGVEIPVEIPTYIPPQKLEMIDPQTGKKKFFTVIIFDNRGSGLSSKPDEPYSITMLAEDTVGLLEAIKVDRVYVLGISMGGLIAQEIAINYPEKVQGLVLVNTHCGGENAVHPTDNVRQVFLDNQGSSEEIIDRKINIFFSRSFIQNFPEQVVKYKMSKIEDGIQPTFASKDSMKQHIILTLLNV